MAGSVIDNIKEHIENGQHFLLSGGAGSGKTYTLMQVLDVIFEKKPFANVACITYTNVAVDEIKHRSPYDKLRVSTIHDFLWDTIKSYQKDLKKSLLELIEKENKVEKTGIKYSGEAILSKEYFSDKEIQYKEYRIIEEGIISHSDVLKLANYLFQNNSLLCSILKDQYDYILVDEYQDTFKSVIDIFLEFLPAETKRKNVIGFFGDSMQAIYDEGVGNISSYIKSGLVKEVVKDDNYRCSKKVIELLNKVRVDINQSAANKNLIGDIKFIYSQIENINIDDVKKHSIFNDWNFLDFENTKELYLTKNLIAKKQGFSEMMEIYGRLSYVDRMLGDNKDRLIKHLFKIQEIIYLYENRMYNEFIKKTDFRISKLADKISLKNNIEELCQTKDLTIEDLINKADKYNLIKKDDSFDSFVKDHKELFDEVKKLKTEQVKKAYYFEEEHSPYSTQHGVKGAEFNNVFVVLDNGGWNKYSFKHLFEETAGKENIIERTLRIFYVCCSRSKNNLVVFYHKPSSSVLAKAKNLFGESNLIEI